MCKQASHHVTQTGGAGSHVCAPATVGREEVRNGPLAGSGTEAARRAAAVASERTPPNAGGAAECARPMPGRMTDEQLVARLTLTCHLHWTCLCECQVVCAVMHGHKTLVGHAGLQFIIQNLSTAAARPPLKSHMLITITGDVCFEKPADRCSTQSSPT